MIISGIIASSIALYRGDFTAYCGELTSFNHMSLLAYTTIIGNGLAYTLYAHGLKQYSANFVSLAGFSVPLFVTIFGALFLGESLSLSFFAAVAVTACGVLLFFKEEIKTLEKRA
jgi:drug/metabolite transporter (DMT)-like permease